MRAPASASAATTSHSGDIWGAVAAMLVALPSAIAYGVLVFSAVDPSLAAQGALYGMLGAAALGLVAPFAGGTACLISAPCAPAAAVLAGLAVSLLQSGIEPARIPGLLALTALLTAVLQIVYGLLRGGRFIKYIPYPVVSGFVSGVALIIAVGQLPKLLGAPAEAGLIAAVADPTSWQWPGLGVGLVTIVVMVLAPRLTQRVPAAILGLGAGIIAYFALAQRLPELLHLRGNELVIGPLQMNASVPELVKSQLQAVLSLQMADLQLVIYPAIALSALLSIDTLKTCLMLDALTHRRHDSNRELLGQGVANLSAFFASGMPGAGATGPTLVNVSSGGSSARSGRYEGLLVVLALLVLAPAIAWVPIAALSGILLVVAFRMFEWSAFRLLRHRNTRLDFAVIAVVVIVAQTSGLITASGVGVALAIFLFIRDQIRGSVLRRSANLQDLSSKTQRLHKAREILDQNGERGGVYDLQGNLFFGTTDQLLSAVEPDMQQRHWMLMDMRRVQSMDYTAANLFRQLNARLQDRGGSLLLCGLPSSLPMRQDIHRYLSEIGLVGNGSGGLQIFDTRDEALEWMEDQVLAEAGWRETDDQHPLELGELELFQDMDEQDVAELASYVEQRQVDAGDRVFTLGDTGDEMYLVRSGSVRILLPLPGGKVHHLATFGRGDFFGEMAFLDKGSRSADAEARTDCELFVLSRQGFNQRSRANPQIGVRVFARLARAVSLRLRHTDHELRMLEDR